MISAPYMLPVIDSYADRFAANGCTYFKAPVEERLEEEDLLRLVGDIDGAIMGDDRVTARVLDAAPKLKVLVKWGTGIDSFDQEACVARGIRLCRTPNAFTQPVSDSILAYMLTFARRSPWMDRMMKAGVWDKIPGRALNECTVGVIGVGCIGQAVLRRAKAFGSTLLGTDIKPVDPAVVVETGVEVVPLDELLQRSDFVVAACDLNPTSRQLMNATRFARMKPTAVFINCARGPIHDEPALVEALRAGTIAGAALDVFEHEPLPKNSPLMDMDNVLMAPHNSNSSPRAWANVHESSLRQLFEALA